MAYNNLNGTKTINGMPADLNAINKLIENDSFFKSEVDADENLTALDRNIIPTADDSFDLGSFANQFSSLYVHDIFTDSISLGNGSLGMPAVTIGTAGLASLNTNELSFVAAGLESVRLMTSGVLVKAANNTQLNIESTEPGSEATWKLGGDLTDFGITFVGTTTDKVLSLTKDAIKPLKQLLVTTGDVSAPGMAFAVDPGMGIYKNNNTLSFVSSGSEKLQLSADAMTVGSSQVLAQDGTELLPAYSFINAINTGFNTNNLDYIEVSIIGGLSALIRETGISSISNLGATTGTKTFSDTETSTLSLEKAKGTRAAPVAPVNEDVLGLLRADGFIERIVDEDFYSYESAAIEFVAQDNFDIDNNGGYLKVKSIPKGEIEAVERLTIGKDDKPTLSVSGSVGINGNIIAGPVSALEVDIKDKSKLLIDTSAGAVEIKGFSGAKEGQILHIVKLDAAGNFTLLHNDATAVQSVLLKGSSNFLISADFGGIILSFDNGQWREISRS